MPPRTVVNFAQAQQVRDRKVRAVPRAVIVPPKTQVFGAGIP